MLANRFGIYVHIPYCLQRCTYCDFATYEFSKIMPPEKYISLLQEEIRQYHNAHHNKSLSTVYFGGGTPSLLDPKHIVSILQSLANHGFTLQKNAEITIEINPATVTDQKMEQYLRAGINRFSVGAQSFNDNLLKSVNREHNAQQTRDTLTLLKKYQTNFSFDILFALPKQTLLDLDRDLEEVAYFNPAHVSPYCLTVPEGHVLSKQKLNDDTQVEMFEKISNFLKYSGYAQYEISNFSKPGMHSRHNYLYWDNSNYWGIGLSAHSYDSGRDWGYRYWNPSAVGAYQEIIEKNRGRAFNLPGEGLSKDGFEVLEPHQALTDFCHTSLRTIQGLNGNQLDARFGKAAAQAVFGHLNGAHAQGLVTQYGDKMWRLTDEGILLSNRVFANLTFLKNEITFCS